MKCIEDEIPFELPSGWVWTRIASISIITPRNTLSDDLEVSFVPMANICDGYRNQFNSDKRIWSKVKTGFTHFAENDIGIAKITPCFENKKSVIFRGLINGYGAGTTELHILRMLPKTIMPEYVLYCVKRDDFILGGVRTFSGDVGQQRVTKEYVANYLISLPPASEQVRIISKIKDAFSIVEMAETAKEDLSEIISKLKSCILDLAIRGKLVPQDPNNEPASVLLDRIRAEKEELIKQGKIKRDKKESVIFKGEDNSYYDDIPENWVLTSLRDITDSCLLNDGDWILSDNMDANGTVKLIQLGSIGFMSYLDKGFKYITQQTFEVLSCTQIKPHYMLINRIISDKMCACILPDIEGTLITTVDTCWIAPNKEYYDLNFLLYALSSPSFQAAVMLNSGGTTRKRISKDSLISLPLPLPPLAEQTRIVKAIETRFALLDKIAESLT